MQLPFFFAAVAEVAAIDPTMPSMIQLIGGLGASAAAVAVVWIFVRYLQIDNEKRDQRYEDFIKAQGTQINQLADAIREINRGVNGMCRMTWTNPHSMPPQINREKTP